MQSLRCMATYESRYSNPILSSIKSYYDVLKVPRNCSGSEIKRAYIELSKKYHPDGNNSTSDPEQFVKVCEAYQVLYKRASRNQYDFRTKGKFFVVPPIEMSHVHQNMHRNWRKSQTDIRNQKVRPIKDSRSSIGNAKQKAVLVTPRLADPIFEPPTNEFWKIVSYLTGFSIVGVLLLIDNLSKRKRIPTLRPLWKLFNTQSTQHIYTYILLKIVKKSTILQSRLLDCDIPATHKNLSLINNFCFAYFV